MFQMATMRVGGWTESQMERSPSPEQPVPPDGVERATASPEPRQHEPCDRPVLHRFYSTPDLLSPGRQQFRLSNTKRQPVKETSGITESQTSVGRQINQYHIKEPIGSGQYGKVFLGIDTQTNQFVAIKELSKSNILKSNRKKIMQLRRRNQAVNAAELIGKEVAIMKKIDHPNLVELIEVLDDETSDSLYMVMEWCKHGQINVTGELDERQCRLYFRDMILAVEYLHSMGVTHRDIKAENVLLGTRDVLKLADFGVSEIVESNDLDNIQSCVGSPGYYAPELASLAHGGMGDPQLSVVSGRKTDIWAMGVTLYYIYHGHLPFQTESLGDLFEQICTKEPTFGSEISPEFRDVLQQLLTKDTDKRITIADLRTHPWVTRNGTDELLSHADNTKLHTSISDEDLYNAIEKAKHLFSRPVTASHVSFSLQKTHGWRGTSGTSTPQTPEGAAASSLNVDKLVRALEEMVKIENHR